MICVKDHKQLQLFDPWGFLSPKRRHLLENSWAGLFKEELLCELPVGAVKPFFTEGFGRPTKELHTALGVLILQQTFDMTDEQAISQLAFNIQWHYALNIPEESDSAKYIAPKTLWNWRSIVIENDLDNIIFNSIASKLAVVFNVNTENQRIDSVHIKSNMRRLGRINIFSQTTHKFLVNLKRGHKQQFESVDDNLVGRYLTEDSLKSFSTVKPSESKKTLATVSNDLFDLVQQFKDCAEVTSMHSYKLLERVFKEQCNVVESDGKELGEVKKPREIPSNSLQNPSDPDATYSGHKGQGFQVQVMETYCDEEDKDKTLNLITNVHVEQAHESDANALIPAIKTTCQKGLAPEKILADSLYGSDSNHQDAKQIGVELTAPVMGKEKEIGLSDFKFSDKETVVSCPQGHSPVQIKKGNRRKSKKTIDEKKKITSYTASFDAEKCACCTVAENCPVKKGKKFHYLRYTVKSARIAKRRAFEKTDEFIDRYRWRAGVEATMSEYDRKTGVKNLRVRGLKAVRFCAVLKAVAINIFRAAAVRKALGISDAKRRHLLAFKLIFKELLECLSFNEYDLSDFDVLRDYIFSKKRFLPDFWPNPAKFILFNECHSWRF